MSAPHVLSLQNVTLVRDGRSILRNINWHVSSGERWVILGIKRVPERPHCVAWPVSIYIPLLEIFDLLGERFGHTDIRTLRIHLGITSQAIADLMRPELTAKKIVMAGRYAALTPWWHKYTAADEKRAHSLLTRFWL